MSDNLAGLIQQSSFAALPAATQAALLTAGVHIAVDQITGFNNAMAFQGLALVFDGGFPGHDADARAESLLRSWLTPEQLEDWVGTRGFTVRGNSTCRRYWVGEGCYELGEDGSHIAYLCFGPVDLSLPYADRVLAKKLALECDEEAVLRVANRVPQPMTGLFSVAQTVVGGPCVIETDRMANLVQAAARELQIRERRQRYLRRMNGIVCVAWGVAALVGVACFLAQAIFN